MKYLFTVIFLLLSQVAIANSFGGIKAKVISYNILCYHCDGSKPNIEDWMQVRRLAWFETFDLVNPDIAGLQEVLDGMYDLIHDRYASEYTFFTRGVRNTYSDHNNTIMFRTSKYSLIDSGRFWLSETPEYESIGWDAEQERVANWVRLEERETGFRFYVYDTHYSAYGSDATRANSSTLVSQQIGGRDNPDFEPALLLGDFNAGLSSAAIQNLVNPPSDSVKFVDVACVAAPGLCNRSTRPSLGYGSSRIDYIFGTAGISSQSAEVVGDMILAYHYTEYCEYFHKYGSICVVPDDYMETYPSDHLGVVADVELWAPVMPAILVATINSVLLN